MRDVAANCPPLGGAALARTARAMASRRAPYIIDLDMARAEFAQLVRDQIGAVTG